MDPPRSDATPPLVLDEYVTIIVARCNGVLPDDETVRELLREVGIGRTEEQWIERGAPDVLYSGFMWEPDRITNELSDPCLATLGLVCVLRAKHQLLYWQPMIEMGKAGRFRGHLTTMEETRDVMRAVSRRLIDRPDLMRKLPQLQPRLAETLVRVLKALPSIVEEGRDREILIPDAISEEDVPTGDDDEIYERDTAEDEDEEVAEAPEYESATATEPDDRAATSTSASPPARTSSGNKGLIIGIIVAVGVLGLITLLALKLLG